MNYYGSPIKKFQLSSIEKSSLRTELKTPEKEDKALGLKSIQDLKFAFRLYDAE